VSLFDLLFKSSKSDPLYKLEKICGYHFRNRSYLKQAFTHRSITSNPRKNYERLEFLGDAVIDIVISKELMKEFPESDEGILTQKRSALVQKSFLSSMGRLLNLLDFLIIDFIDDLQNLIFNGFAQPSLSASFRASFKAFVSHIELTSFAGHTLFHKNIFSVLKLFEDEIINSHLFLPFFSIIGLE